MCIRDRFRPSALPLSFRPVCNSFSSSTGARERGTSGGAWRYRSMKLLWGLASLGAGIILASCNQAAPKVEADSVVLANGPTCVPSVVHAPDLVALHVQHPRSANAPGSLPLNSPILQHLLTKWPDPRSFISQATPRELATYGFIGEPAYSGPATAGPHSPDDPVDIIVFHGNWSANEVNMHGYGHGAHVRWIFVDAQTGDDVGGGSADCTNE